MLPTHVIECALESAPDAIVISDASLLGQVLRNLVSNAIKYTRHGRVLLRCLYAPTFVRLEVADTGVGIPGDQLPYIYDEFFQIGVTPNTKSEGYGLGLAIVNRIVRLLGLKLEVESEPGKGSSFRLEVPAVGARSEAGREPREQPTSARPQPERAPRILLVDDDANVRSATRMLLESAGYDIATAASCTEALARLEAHARFDLLITDFHLGADGTGVEVIALARQRLGAGLPAILLSGDTSRGVQGREHDERWRIASKPLQAEQLLALIEDLLGR